KNLVVGCGGSAFINQSHMLGAFYGMERIMGRDHSPVRKVFDYAQEHFLDKLPLAYILTAADAGGIKGLYCGQGRALFEKALALSTNLNMTHLDKPIKKCVVYLDPHEFHSTWLGNKAIYRTRLAMADGGQLIILAPGVKRFGEDDENDVLIRKYGYVGRLKVLELVKEQEDLQNNLSVAAHLIHGSSDDRFSITYCAPFLSPQEIEKANFIHANYNEMLQKYNPETLKDGWQIIDNEEIYYISNPALGLWGLKT
ncbi:MAG: D-mannonate epimerase, partial [Clostridia bacterium]|nr:D-mannonate epimerase [Clostridia bacterium]